MSYQFSRLQLEWLAALKSGKYKQGEDRLARRDATKHCFYCCLGVACVVVNKLSVELGVPKVEKYIDTEDDIHFGGSELNLPTSLIAPLKLRDDKGSFKLPVTYMRDDVSKHADCLTQLNDDAHWSFKQIAAYIEQNPRNVFVS